MKTSAPKDHQRNVSGKVLIELLLVAPILLMIPAGVMEYARFLRQDQIAVVYSQEAANRAYRDCADFYETRRTSSIDSTDKFNVSATKNATQVCINQVRSEILASMNLYLPGSQLILSTYRYNFDTNASPATDTLTRVAVVPAQPAGGTYGTTFVGIGPANNTLVQVGPRTGELVSLQEVQKRERFIVAEVSFNYSTVLPIFKAFFRAASITTNGEYRETTIL